MTHEQPIDDRISERTGETIIVEQKKRKTTNRRKKKSLSQKAEKIYKVTITYVQLTQEKALIKRAIFESMIKNLVPNKFIWLFRAHRLSKGD